MPTQLPAYLGHANYPTWLCQNYLSRDYMSWEIARAAAEDGILPLRDLIEHGAFEELDRGAGNLRNDMLRFALALVDYEELRKDLIRGLVR